jgi:ABC-type nitrate/sulfonate/bicarbonate transport system substrate-binding protein
VLVVTQRYLTANPAAVRSLLKAQTQACAQFSAHRAAAQMIDTQTRSSAGIIKPVTSLAGLYDLGPLS